MKPNELFSTFKEGSLYPLYYFCGEDQYLLDLVVRCVETQGGFEDRDPLSYEIFYGGSTPLVAILESARSLPFLGSKKLVLVRESEKIPPDDRKQLLAYCTKPSSKSTVVFTERVSKKRGREKKERFFNKKLLDGFEEQGMALSIPPAKRAEIPSWIQYFAQAQKKTIEKDGADLLHELIGESIQDLAAAVEKVALFTGAEERITRTAVEQTISRVRTETVFEVAEHISSGRRKQAIVALGRLLENEEEPLFILSMIARQFRLIFMAHALLDQGASFRELQKALNSPDFVVKKVLPQAQTFSRARLEACYELLWRADWSFKSMGTSQKVLLEQLVLDLCG